MIRGLRNRLREAAWSCLARVYLRLKGVRAGRGFVALGLPRVYRCPGGTIEIGRDCRLNSTVASNPIGRNHPVILYAAPGARLSIGDRVGISGSALVAHREVRVEDDVLIGGDVVVYDTDFHPLNAEARRGGGQDGTRTAPVRIGRNAFVGAHAIVLKGVTIGANAVIGAGAVVTHDVPPGEIWAGNPARRLRRIEVGLETPPGVPDA